MLDVKMDQKPIYELEKKVKKLGKAAYPIAVKTTLNNTAYEARKIANKELSKDFTLRNKWTARGNWVNKVDTKILDDMKSEFGSQRDYMRDQETGFTEKEPMIATKTARVANSNKKPVRGANRLSKISLSNRTAKVGGVSNRQEKRSIILKNAIQTGRRFVFLKFAKFQGIFKVTGGRKKGINWDKGMKTKMLYSSLKQNITVKATKWLEPASNKAVKKQAEFFRKALEFQIDRMNK